ncbi:hypothetical protein ANCCAN_10743 [Ancylostoma caninum]|uniref:Uncharacterized protein n=1 Tax=Ancylostoma caninum TaxID=29170 RepID=A0A368GJR9_ANCCA|nr:hypothetical protein ANCCAN_10743 [Ancylostoma caninum]
MILVQVTITWNRFSDPPQSHSTPKAAHHSQIRPESATPMSREQKLTWGRLPPSAGYRSASAMAQHMRPASRQSDAGIAQCKHGTAFSFSIKEWIHYNTFEDITCISLPFAEQPMCGVHTTTLLQLRHIHYLYSGPSTLLQTGSSAASRLHFYQSFHRITVLPMELRTELLMRRQTTWPSLIVRLPWLTWTLLNYVSSSLFVRIFPSFSRNRPLLILSSSCLSAPDGPVDYDANIDYLEKAYKMDFCSKTVQVAEKVTTVI